MLLKSEDIYKIENQRMLIIDSEMNLKIDAPFDPLYLPKKPLWGQELEGNAFVVGNASGQEFFIEKFGKPHGQCRLYFANGSVKAEMFYQEGLLHGPSTFFDEKGALLSHSWFVNGLQEGKCYWYYGSGNLYSVQRFKNGLKDGSQEYFFEGGTLKTTLQFQNGSLSHNLSTSTT